MAKVLSKKEIEILRSGNGKDGGLGRNKAFLSDTRRVAKARRKATIGRRRKVESLHAAIVEDRRARIARAIIDEDDGIEAVDEIEEVAKHEERITIPPPNWGQAAFTIIGASPYVMHKFGFKKRKQMHEDQESGSKKKKGAKRPPKNFKQEYEEAQHRSKDGWHGIPAPAFRLAMIDACRLCGYKMTFAKMSIFVLADGFDSDDGTPLVRITKGKPHYVEHAVRNSTGVIDLRARPMWDPGWEAKVRVRYDADQFDTGDVFNLLQRAGDQIGVGEGRPFSKKSAGQGWGLWEVSKKGLSFVPKKSKEGRKMRAKQKAKAAS